LLHGSPDFLSATINLALRIAIRKSKYYSKELTTLAVGYVTHIDHGIGRFGGLQKIQVENRTQEAIKASLRGQ
jgi:transcription-repair coupling factor (superfamily II helicase)